MTHTLRYVVLISTLLLVDQVSKYQIRLHFTEGMSLPIREPFFYLTYIENSGAAFGLLSGNTWLLTLFTFLFLVLLIVYMWRISHPPRLLKLGVSLVVAGALGNLWDRLAKGSVTDMFDFRIWPIFNVADICVSLGFVLLVIYVVRYEDI